MTDKKQLPSEPERKMWVEGIEIVRMSDVGEDFMRWLYGQTLPLVIGDPTPQDWAYAKDYERFKAGLKVID
jgi:hypothetical protein